MASGHGSVVSVRVLGTSSNLFDGLNFGTCDSIQIFEKFHTTRSTQALTSPGEGCLNS